MADSENEYKPLPAELPEGVTSLMVRGPDGISVSERLKNAKGQFVKKPKPLLPTIEFTRAERKALNKAAKEGDQTEYMKAFMNLVRIAQYDGDDAKAMMAAVKAFEVLRLSALGKPAPSEQELDKLTVQPFKVVFVESPAGVKPMEERPPEKTKPAFIEATVVQQN